MFKFKIKYKDDNGQPVEVEVEVSLPSLTSSIAASQLGISASKIISIKKL